MRVQDFFFNSSFEYEICILKTRIEAAAQNLNPEERDLLARYLPLELLDAFHPCFEANIPEDSIFNEFYK